MRFGIGMNTDHTLEEVGQQVLGHPRAKYVRSKPRPCASSSTRARSRKLRSFLDN